MDREQMASIIDDVKFINPAAVHALDLDAGDLSRQLGANDPDQFGQRKHLAAFDGAPDRVVIARFGAARADPRRCHGDRKQYASEMQQHHDGPKQKPSIMAKIS